MAVLLMSFASGLPFNLSGSGFAFQAWLASEGVNLKAIGFYSLVVCLHLQILVGALARSLPAASSRPASRLDCGLPGLLGGGHRRDGLQFADPGPVFFFLFPPPPPSYLIFFFFFHLLLYCFFFFFFFFFFFLSLS